MQFLEVIEAIPLKDAVTPLLPEPLGPTRHQFMKIPSITKQRLLECEVDSGPCVKAELRNRTLGFVVQHLQRVRAFPRQTCDIMLTCLVAHALLLTFWQMEMVCALGPHHIGVSAQFR